VLQLHVKILRASGVVLLARGVAHGRRGAAKGVLGVGGILERMTTTAAQSHLIIS